MHARQAVTAGAALGIALIANSCEDNITSPMRGVRIQRESVIDTLFVGEPGGFTTRDVKVRVYSPTGAPLAGARVEWSTVGTEGEVERSTRTGDDGIARVRWRLGTSAATRYRLIARVPLAGLRDSVSFAGRAIPTRVAWLNFSSDTVLGDVGDTLAVSVEAADQYGNRFTPDSLLFEGDPARVKVLAGNRLTLLARGSARVTVSAGAGQDTLAITARQVVSSILAPDSLLFASIGEQRIINATLIDRRGLSIRDSLPLVELGENSPVSRNAGSGIVLVAEREGVGSLLLRAGSVARPTAVTIRQRAVRVALDSGHVSFDALGDSLQLQSVAYDAFGSPLATGRITYQCAGDTVVAISADGWVRAVRPGRALVIASADAASDTASVAVSQRPASLTAEPASLRINALGGRASVTLTVRDHNGNRIPTAPIELVSNDTGIVRVDADRKVTARATGTAIVYARSDTLTLGVPVAVQQVPASILLDHDSLVFDALSASAQIRAIVLDSLGVRIPGASVRFAAENSAIAQVAGDTIVSVANGSTGIIVSSDGASRRLAVAVAQQAVGLLVDEALFAQPRSARVGDFLDLDIRGQDRLGNAMPIANSQVRVDTVGVVRVGSAGGLVVEGSGWVDVDIRSGSFQLTKRLRIYVAPELIAREASGVELVGLPDTVNPWAPTLVAAPNGTTRLYFAAYKPSPGDDVDRADLDYFDSADGHVFTYRGTAMPRAPAVTDPFGWGIENVAIVPRNDGPGNRMYFAAGSTTLGWQVFSAVGDGVGPWTPEPGIRIGNDGGESPQGEGMVVLPKEGGGYRMFAGSMYVTKVSSGSWQIVEYESNDQLNWTFRREHLAQGVDGDGDSRAVYSPTIVKVGRGLYRMFYTGDNLRLSPTPQSNMWSAVSFDLEHWRTEGPFIAAEAANVMYASALGDRIAYLLSPCSGCKARLAIGTMLQR